MVIQNVFLLLQWVHDNGTPYTLQMQKNSRFWHFRFMKQINTFSACKRVDIDQCMFGSPYKSSLTFLSGYLNWTVHDTLCTGTHGLCSRSGKRHVQVQGYCQSRNVPKKFLALDYTTKLAHSVAYMFHLKQVSSFGRWLEPLRLKADHG